MTKETIGYVQLEWTCPNCGSKNPGPNKSCSECGGPQPDDIQFEQAAQEELITNEEELARAMAGPDIHCAFCGARNPASAETCSQCGADLSEGTARESGQVVGAHRDTPAPNVPCPSCGALNPANARECSQCGGSMARRRVSRRAAAPSSGGCGKIGIVIVGAVVLLAIGFIILASRTTDVVGRVTSVGWTRSIAVLGLGPVTRADWRDEIPSDGVIGSCEQRVHHSQDDPAPNAEKVCGTPYTVDTGSGFGEVVQDCQYQVYEAWCEYTVQEWRVVDTLALDGQDFAPRWPAIQLATDQREGARDESYTCIFNADGQNYTYRTSNVDQFSRCEIGSRWTLKVSALGGVSGIEPAD